MGKYLITLKPMEPYFFGGERTFGFGKETEQKQPYYIVSENTPSQPTLFGTLRYIVLSKNDALWGQKNANKATEFVGEKSFSFDKVFDYHEMVRKAAAEAPDTPSFTKDHMLIKKECEHGFGKINSISPLFLVKDEVWYIKTPMDHKTKTNKKVNAEYSPMEFAQPSEKYGDKFRYYPIDYVAKDGYGGGYVSLNDLGVIPDDKIFLTDVRTGINSHRTDDPVEKKDDNDSLFKKERKMLADGFSFAFIADVDDSISLSGWTSVVFMGQDRSPFLCKIEETKESLTTRVENAFIGRHGNLHMIYALSDVMPVEGAFPGGKQIDFYIADTRVMRNLETKANSNSYHERLKKSKKLYKVINAGAVFITDHEICENNELKKIGMNIFVKI